MLKCYPKVWSCETDVSNLRSNFIAFKHPSRFPGIELASFLFPERQWRTDSRTFTRPILSSNLRASLSWRGSVRSVARTRRRRRRRPTSQKMTSSITEKAFVTSARSSASSFVGQHQLTRSESSFSFCPCQLPYPKPALVSLLKFYLLSD